MRTIKFLGHQGDILVFKIEGDLPDNLIQNTQTKQGILAYGEGSGHAHQVVSEDQIQAELFVVLNKAYEGLLFLKSEKPVRIEHGRARDFEGKEADHDYHKTIEVNGRNFFSIQKETDWLTRTVRRVVD